VVFNLVAGRLFAAAPPAPRFQLGHSGRWDLAIPFTCGQPVRETIKPALP